MTPRAVLVTPTPAPMTRRIVARMILFMSVVSGLLLIPLLTELREVHAARLAWLFVLLLPSTLVLAFPFAMGFTVDGVRRHSRPTHGERIAMLRAAILAVVFTIVLGGWIVPATNQHFRLTVWGDRTPPPARGARELTTTQLIRTPWLARAEGTARPVAIQRELHNRASLAVLPVILMWLRWRALERPSPRWLLPAWLAATVTIGIYFVVRANDANLEAMFNLRPGGGAWMPLAGFVLIGLVRDRIVNVFETRRPDASAA
jgi:hypothetical protein